MRLDELQSKSSFPRLRIEATEPPRKESDTNDKRKQNWNSNWSGATDAGQSHRRWLSGNAIKIIRIKIKFQYTI